MIAPTDSRQAKLEHPVQYAEILEAKAKGLRVKGVPLGDLAWGVQYAIQVGGGQYVGLGLVASHGKWTRRAKTMIPDSPVPTAIAAAKVRNEAIRQNGPWEKLDRRNSPQFGVIGGYARIKGGQESARVLFWTGLASVGVEPNAAPDAVTGLRSFYPRLKLVEKWAEAKPGDVFKYSGTRFRRLSDSETLSVVAAGPGTAKQSLGGSLARSQGKLARPTGVKRVI